MAESLRTVEAPMPMIVGVGRSGTTLLRLMIDAHPLFSIPAETGFLIPLFDRPALARDEFLALVTGFHTWPDLDLPAELYGSALRDCEAFTVAEGVRLFYRLYAQRNGKLRWGDKTPLYGQYLRQIEQVLPEAHFIHIVRDGRDVALSLRATWFAPSQDACALARHWREQVQTTSQAGARCRHYLQIRFEDLVHEPEAILRRVCDFIRVPFDSAMLDYHRSTLDRLSEVQARTLADGVVISQQRRLANHRFATMPPEPSRVGRWRSEMDSADQRAFADEAGDLLAELGYDAG